MGAAAAGGTVGGGLEVVEEGGVECGVGGGGRGGRFMKEQDLPVVLDDGG